MTLLELYQRADQQGIDIDYFPMRQVKSVSFPDGMIAIDVDKVATRQEEKTVLAHELGHCETGSFYNIYSKLDIRGKHERRADERAFQLLVPKSDLDEAVKAGITETWELAEYFDVPSEFMQKAMTYYHEIDLAK